MNHETIRNVSIAYANREFWYDPVDPYDRPESDRRWSTMEQLEAMDRGDRERRDRIAESERSAEELRDKISQLERATEA